MKKLPYIIAAITILPLYVMIMAYLEIWHLVDLHGQRRFQSGIKP